MKINRKRNEPANEKAKTIISYTLLFLVIILFLLTIYFLTIQGNNEVNLAKRSADWPAVDGVIVESEQESYYRRSRRSSGYVHIAKVTYSYTVDGQIYQTYPVSIGEPRVESIDQKNVQLVLDKYPLGKEVKVYYDPENPETAVLEPGVTQQNYGSWATAISISIVVSGIIIIFLPYLREARRQSKLRRSRKGKRNR